MTPAALDITIAIILLLSALVAYFRGIIREAFTIVALIVATTTTYFGGEMMIPAWNKWLKVDARSEEAAAAVSKAAATGAQLETAVAVKAHLFMGLLSYDKLAVICAYASVFIFFYLVMSLVGFFVSRAVNEAGLGLVDRLLGAGFGLARGFLVVFLCFLPISFMFKHDQFPEWAKNSVSVPILEQSVAFVDEKLDLKNRIQENGKLVLSKIQDYKRPEAAPEAADKDKGAPVSRPDMDEEDDNADLHREIMEDERKAMPQ